MSFLDEFSSLNIICLWNFMTNSFYFRLLTGFWTKFSGKYGLLMLSGDIEWNSDPRPNSGQSLSICQCNLNVCSP